MRQPSVYDLYWLSEDNDGLFVPLLANLLYNTFLYFYNIELLELLILLKLLFEIRYSLE